MKRWGFFIAAGLLQVVSHFWIIIVHFRSVFGRLRTDLEFDKNFERFSESLEERFKKY